MPISGRRRPYSVLTRLGRRSGRHTCFSTSSGGPRAGMEGWTWARTRCTWRCLDGSRSEHRDEELRKDLAAHPAGGACTNHCSGLHLHRRLRLRRPSARAIWQNPSPHLLGCGEARGDLAERHRGLVRCLRRGVPGASPIPDMLQRLRRGGQARRSPATEPLAGAGRPGAGIETLAMQGCLCRHHPRLYPHASGWRPVLQGG